MEQFRINWQLILLLMVAGQALLFAVILLLQSRANRKANFLLGIILLLLVWHHLDFVVNTSFWYQQFPYFFTPHYISWFLFGPLLYLYMKFLRQPDYKPDIAFYLNFVPALLAFANYAPLYFMNKVSKIEFITQSVITNNSSATELLQPLIPGSVIFTSQIVVLTAFILLCFANLLNAWQQRSKAIEPQSDINLQWLSLVLLSFTLAVLVSNFYFRAIWVNPVLDLGTSIYFYIAPLTLLLLVIEIKALLTPEIYTRFAVINPPKEKYQKSTLDTEQAQSLVHLMQNYMNSNKPYRDSELRINTLSRELRTPVNHLSQAINQQLGQNFTDFVNRYRVKEAQRILDATTDHKINLLDVALEVGFNNKTSFLNAFKKQLNTSPSRYRRTITTTLSQKS